MEIPKWIDSRYERIKPLGTGGSSTIYQAIDRKDPDERMVALKLLGSLPMQNRELLQELFAREVRALIKLSHPNIVQMYDFGHDAASDFLYLVLEHVERAETLKVRVPKWKPNVLECVEILIELLNTLAYAHGIYVIHRDLNPSNILIGEDGRLKVIDFGISKILGEITAEQTVGELYTRAYASPEQLLQRPIGPLSDLYSISAVGFFLLTFADPKIDCALGRQFEVLSPANGRDIPKDLLVVLKRMASEEPSERYQSASQAALALERLRQGLQAQTQQLYVQLTNNAVNQLAQQLVIDRATGDEARDYVAHALTGDVYLLIDDSSDTGQYDILGETLSLRCKACADSDGHNNAYFVAISVKADIPPHIFERKKQSGFRVLAQWRVGTPAERNPSGVVPLSGLLDEAEDYFHHKSVDLKQRQKRLDLVESWQHLLYLDREIKSEQSAKVEYISWEAVHNQTVIRVALAQAIENAESGPFIPGQLLLMSSRNRNSVPVGHYLDSDRNSLRISKLASISLDRIAPSGVLTGDDRQWAAAWNRQRLALNALVDGHSQNPRLPEILLSPAKAGYVQFDPVEKFFSSRLDEAKRDAVSAALCARDIYLVQGPPGTGKTVLIAEIVTQLLVQNPHGKILLVSQSNVAVDHVLSSLVKLLHEHNIDREVVRVGREEVIAPDVQSSTTNSKLNAWTADIKRRCSEYLQLHYPKTLDQDGPNAEMEILDLVVGLLQSPEEHADEISSWIALLQKQFPTKVVEPDKESLERLRSELSASAVSPKVGLERTLEEWILRVGKVDDFEEAYLQSCSVIAGTCVGIAGVKNLPDAFDWVIVDEAGRATPAELLIPLVRGRRGILVGDHKQLPPVIEHTLQRRASMREDIDPSWLEQSLFEYLFINLTPQVKTILRTQYRMHPTIAGLISASFYREEKLITGVTHEDCSHQWAKWPTAIVWYSTSGIDRRRESSGGEESKLNECEAELITQQLSALEHEFCSSEIKKTVGVIAGYSAQIKLLKRRLDPDDTERWQALNIEVNTVDAFQGRERDIVFYSVVRSNPKREIGFLKDARRLNVALSRARELLFIVGDHRMLAEANVTDGHNPFIDVLKYIHAHPAECRLMEAVQ